MSPLLHHHCTITAPPGVIGLILRIALPIAILLLWFPFFKVLVSQIVPSLFVSYAYLQITALIGTFPLGWEGPVNSIFTVLKFANFNLDLTLVDCSLGFNFVLKWYCYMAIPIFYFVYYISRYYADRVFHWLCSFAEADWYGPSLHHHRTITAPPPHHHCTITAPSLHHQVLGDTLRSLPGKSHLYYGHGKGAEHLRLQAVGERSLLLSLLP